MIELTVLQNPALQRPIFTNDTQGNQYASVPISDYAGKDAPFPNGDYGFGCTSGLGLPQPCSDVAVYKFSKSGDLAFVDYLCGKTNEAPVSLDVAPDGSIVVTGVTDSNNFPTTPSAFQPAYAGPAAVATLTAPPEISGDLFATKIDPTTGAVLASTFFGGPNAEQGQIAHVGADGSVYFLPKFLEPNTSQMPTTAGALQPQCDDTLPRCTNGYAARLSASLDKLLFGTYLPGANSASAKLHADGSIYFGGVAASGFPTTPGALQSQSAGGYDATVGRLDPTGSRLLFATYIGSVNDDSAFQIADSPDGSVWVDISAQNGQTSLPDRLVHLDAAGQKILADLAISTISMGVDSNNNLIAEARGAFPPLLRRMPSS